MEEKFLTHENGSPVENNTHSLTAGQRGPITLEDTWLIEVICLPSDRPVLMAKSWHHDIIAGNFLKELHQKK